MVCITLLVGDVFVDPSNKIFYLKYFIFGLIFLIWLPNLLSKQTPWSRSLVIITFFIAVFMPLYALSISLINSFLNYSDVGIFVFFNSFFFFLLVLIIVNKNIDLTKIFNVSSLLVVIITMVSYTILIYNPHLFGNLYQYLVIDKNAASYGIRQYGNFTLLMMFYKTSPLLIFPLSYYLYHIINKKDIKNLFLKILILISIVITLFLSGTRANILSLFLILSFYFLFYLYKKSKPIFTIVSIFYSLISIYGVFKIGGILFDAQEISNQIKFQHLISYFEHFSNHFEILIFGQGIGTSFYSLGFNKITNVTELTYFELIRIWGIPITLFFLYILIFPIVQEIKSKKISHLFIAYIAYLFVAGTNPLLLSSTGMIVLVYVFSQMFIIKNYTI